MIFPAPVHQDIPCQLPGMTFFWTLLESGWDLTGYTAHMEIDGLATNLSVPVTVTTVGIFTNSSLDAEVANSVTLTWPAGVYRYRVILTLTADGSNAVAAYGDLNVLTPRGI